MTLPVLNLTDAGCIYAKERGNVVLAITTDKHSLHYGSVSRGRAFLP
ncbi:hypothetical protein [Indioceanicola profundi]|nr:hypothetical protein [Indioceanicola profundi]